MQAVTDFAATRALIVQAFKVFSEGFALANVEVKRKRSLWIEEKIQKAWFNKDRDYWTEYAHGRNNGAFETRLDSACVNSGFYFGCNYHWYEARIKDVTQLLQKFDCAVDNCEAMEVMLSDDDLSLLSISLQSALRN